MASYLKITGQVSGSWGSKTIDLTVQNASTAGAIHVPPTTLSADTDVTFTCPQGCKGMILIPASDNTTEWHVKGVAGDTGPECGLADPVVVTVDTSAGAADFIVRPVGGSMVLEAIGF